MPPISFGHLTRQQHVFCAHYILHTACMSSARSRLACCKNFSNLCSVSVTIVSHMHVKNTNILPHARPHTHGNVHVHHDSPYVTVRRQRVNTVLRGTVIGLHVRVRVVRALLLLLFLHLFLQRVTLHETLLRLLLVTTLKYHIRSLHNWLNTCNSQWHTCFRRNFSCRSLVFSRWLRNGDPVSDIIAFVSKFFRQRADDCAVDSVVGMLSRASSPAQGNT